MGKRKIHTVNDDDDLDEDTKWQIQLIYIAFAIIWIILVYLFSLYCKNILISLLALIPLIVFGFNYYWIKDQTKYISNLMFSADFLSIGFLIVTIVINWYRDVDKGSIFGLVVLTLALFGFSMIDFWLPEENFILLQHSRSALETMAVVILTIAIYIFYIEVQQEVYFA